MPANCLIIYVSIIDDQLVPACDNSEVLRDIYDGEVFQHLMKPPNSLSISVNTGLILSMDGVPVFKSAKEVFGQFT